nr:hypothetical protein L204_04425 [Cryptococcus depauperatus CBS 7855]
MARDPPSILSSTELADLSLRPTAVKSAKITIIHPQLRDLILPLSRGRVFYPRGTTVEEIRWMPQERDDNQPRAAGKSDEGDRKTAFKLDFAPNCLVANETIFACGGQHGELFVTDLPEPYFCASRSYHPSPKFNPFVVSTMLPNSRSINNSIIIPPSWPKEWSRRSRERRLGYLGRGNRTWEEIDCDGRHVGKAKNGYWASRRIKGEMAIDESLNDDDDGYDDISAYPSGGEQDEEGDEDEIMSDSERTASIVATYPNTLPVRYVSSHIFLPTSLARKKKSAPKFSPREVAEEPRLIISNNDRTVALYRLSRKPYSGSQDNTQSTFDNMGHLGTRTQRPPRNASSPQNQAGWSRARGDDGLLSLIHSHPYVDNTPKEERVLHSICKARFPVAANHSSLSPDLQHLISVGDSTDVTLSRLSGDGREIKKVAIYKAGTDAGFSSAWSKDGRKFAVASQDGQVTVWDHRSSRPLAIFHTSSSTSTSSTPSFVHDVTESHQRSNSDAESASSSSSQSQESWDTPMDGEAIILRDPVTGTPRAGSSMSGKEAARVVKFSPEGSTRDLMVFSELSQKKGRIPEEKQENSNIHIVDARTFSTHVVVPVPHVPTHESDPIAMHRPRKGVEGGTWGIAGIAFDPTGNFLYSGTERTVVEWDMRRIGHGQGIWGLI